MTWLPCVLQDLVHLQRGFDITKAEQAPGNVPVISSSGIQSFHNQPKAIGPGVIIGRKGTVGAVHYSATDYWPHDTTLWSKDLKGNDPKFVYYFLQTLNLGRFDTGNSNPTLNRNHIHVLPIKKPDLNTQLRIADILSAYDNLIENNRRRIALLEQAARELYREWFVRLRFPGHEHVKIVDGVPEGWTPGFVPDRIDVNPAVRLPKGQEAWHVPMGALSETGMSVDVAQIERRVDHTSVKFQNNDVLLARITPCLENGKTGFVSFLSEGEAASGSTEFIVLRGKQVSPFFTYCLARSDHFRGAAIKSMTGSSGRQRVQPDFMREYKLPLAPASLLTQFDEFCEPTFEQISVLLRQTYKLAQSRDLLLPRLMNGSIAV